MASVDEAAASLGANKSEAVGLAGQLAVSKQQTEELQSEIAVLGAEGAANRASAAVQTIEGLMSEAAGLAERIGEAQAQVLVIKQAGSLSTTTGATSGTPPSEVSSPGPKTGEPVRPLAAVAPHRSFDAEKAKPIKPFIGRRRTVGALYIGGNFVGQLLWSGEDGPAADTDGVKPRWALKSSVRTHTEGHAAAVMRSRAATDAEIYINRAVCDVAPDGCIQRIPEVLAPGCKLRVFDVSRPEVRPVILKGTGEGLVDGDQ